VTELSYFYSSIAARRIFLLEDEFDFDSISSERFSGISPYVPPRFRLGLEETDNYLWFLGGLVAGIVYRCFLFSISTSKFIDLKLGYTRKF
jgi:hypothetical protein